MKALLPPNEADRLAALREYSILDSEPELAFDELAQLAAHICECPSAFIGFIDQHHQWFKAHIGLKQIKVPREESFCQYTILQNEPLIVRDATLDSRFANNAHVASEESSIRFYAGITFFSREGYALGTLCVADRTARDLSSAQLRSLAALARQVTAQLEVRRQTFELERASYHAREATRLKANSLVNMSHELRTPLNGVNGMTELLLDTALDEEQREYAETIRHCADSLLSIVDDILYFSNIEAGRLCLDKSAFDAHAVVEEVIGTMSERALDKGIEIAAHVSADVPVRDVYGATRCVRQILINLVNNAVKFTQAGGVSVSVTKEREEKTAIVLRFRVTDTGIGITEEARAGIFQPYTQADASTTRRQGGAGLGLTIAKHLVESLNGEIDVNSKQGEGSTFTFSVQIEKLSASLEHAPGVFVNSFIEVNKTAAEL